MIDLDAVSRAIGACARAVRKLTEEERAVVIETLCAAMPTDARAYAQPMPEHDARARSEHAARAARARWSHARARASLSDPDLNSSLSDPTLSSLVPGSETETDARPRAKKRKKAMLVSMPDGWIPRAEEREKAISFGLDCDAEADRFRTWTESKASRFANWDAAFRNHLDRQAERNKAMPNNGGKRSEQEWQRIKAEDRQTSAYAGWDVFGGGKSLGKVGR